MHPLKLAPLKNRTDPTSPPIISDCKNRNVDTSFLNTGTYIERKFSGRCYSVQQSRAKHNEKIKGDILQLLEGEITSTSLKIETNYAKEWLKKPASRLNNIILSLDDDHENMMSEIGKRLGNAIHNVEISPSLKGNINKSTLRMEKAAIQTNATVTSPIYASPSLSPTKKNPRVKNVKSMRVISTFDSKKHQEFFLHKIDRSTIPVDGQSFAILPSTVIEKILEHTTFIMPMNFFDIVDISREKEIIPMIGNKSYFSNLRDEVVQKENSKGQDRLFRWLRRVAEADRRHILPLIRRYLLRLLYGYTALDPSRRVFMMFKHITLYDTFWAYNIDFLKFSELRSLRSEFKSSSAEHHPYFHDVHFFANNIDVILKSNPSLESIEKAVIDYSFCQKYKPIVKRYIKKLGKLSYEVKKKRNLQWLLTGRKMKKLELSCIDITENTEIDSDGDVVDENEYSGYFLLAYMFPPSNHGNLKTNDITIRKKYPQMKTLKLSWIDMKYETFLESFPNLTSLSLSPVTDSAILYGSFQEKLLKGELLPNLKKLKLKGVTLVDSAQLGIVYNTSLTVLKLLNCHKVIPSYICSNSSIKKLKIEGYHDSQAHEFFGMPYLDELHIDSKLSKKCCKQIRENSTLKTLFLEPHFERSVIQNNVSYAFECISKVESLRKLSLFDGFITKKGLSMICRMSSLSKLYLFGVKGVEEKALLSLRHHPQLRTLRIFKCDSVGDKCVRQLVPSLPLLRSLELSRTGASNKTLSYLLNSTSLHTVRLSHIKIESIEDLVGLTSDKCAIQKLHLRKINAMDAQNLVRILMQNKSLTSFHCQVPRIVDEKMVYKYCSMKIKELYVQAVDKLTEEIVTIRDFYSLLPSNRDRLKRKDDILQMK